MLKTSFGSFRARETCSPTWQASLNGLEWLKAVLRLPERRVFAGTMDAWAGMFGIGVVRDGDAMYLSGTSEVVGIISDAVRPTPGVIVFPPYGQIRLHAAPTQSGGASLDWIARLLGKSAEDALDLAAASKTIRRNDIPAAFARRTSAVVGYRF